MSEKGRERRFRRKLRTSAFPPIADIIAESHRLASYQSEPRRGPAHRRQHRHYQARRTRSLALTAFFSLLLPRQRPREASGKHVEASTMRWHAGGMIARPSSHSATGRQALSCRQLLKQRLRLFQIERVEPFGEPVVDWRKKIAGLLPLTLIAPEPRHAH
jgi:hypothetical protein